MGDVQKKPEMEFPSFKCVLFLIENYTKNNNNKKNNTHLNDGNLRL